MRLRRSIFLLALCLAPLAHADDWLAGEYEVFVPDRPAPQRFMLTITKDDGVGYRAEVFKEEVDATTGKTLMRPMPPGASAEERVVQVMAPAEMVKSGASDAEAASVHCAVVNGMGLCKIDDGASLTLDGQTLHGGYFGSAMHTGLIEVHKLAPHGTQAAASAGGEHNP